MEDGIAYRMRQQQRIVELIISVRVKSLNTAQHAMTYKVKPNQVKQRILIVKTVPFSAN